MMMKRTIIATDALLTRTGRYFLPMAAACALGVGLVYAGLRLHSDILIVVGLALGMPLWLWSIPFLLSRAFVCGIACWSTLQRRVPCWRYFAAGVIANVLVAWLLTIIFPIDRLSAYCVDLSISPDPVCWCVHGERLGHRVVHATLVQGLTQRDAANVDLPLLELPQAWGRILTETDEGYGEMSRSAQFREAGWPFRSMWGAVREISYGTRWPASTQYEGALLLSYRSPFVEFLDQRFLPLRPTWLGFAANSLFYALVFWIKVRGTVHVKRRYRLSRGVCPICTYPNGNSERCPECGHLFDKPAVVR